MDEGRKRTPMTMDVRCYVYGLLDMVGDGGTCRERVCEIKVVYFMLDT